MFAKNGEEMKLEETEEFKKLVESARRDILAQMAMRETLKDVVVSEEEIELTMRRTNNTSQKETLSVPNIF